MMEGVEILVHSLKRITRLTSSFSVSQRVNKNHGQFLRCNHRQIDLLQTCGWPHTSVRRASLTLQLLKLRHNCEDHTFHTFIYSMIIPSIHSFIP